MKISLIVLGGLCAIVLLRHRSAALRHWVLAASVACAAMVPVLESALPVWRLPFAAPSTFERYAVTEVPAVGAGLPAARPSLPTGGAHSPGLSSPAGPGGWDFPSILTATWVSGAVLGLCLLLVGILRLRWLASHARLVQTGRWRDLADEISHAAGFRRPVVLLQSDHPSLLVTWGFARPKVILPADAATWSDARARVVLTHELAHIRRGDWMVQLAAEVFRAVYWFNPLLWIVCRTLRLESEHACDDEVMSQGVEGTDYANHLVELARALGHRRYTWFPAPAMARPSSLERRVRAMLNQRVNRKPINGAARAAIFIALLAVTSAVAAAQSGFVSFGGSVFDEQNRGIPGVSLVLTNEKRQMKYEVKTSDSGRFEFVGLPGGEYGLEVRGTGFGTLRDTVTVAGQNLQRNVMLKLGTLQESINVTFDDRPDRDAAGAKRAPSVREVPMPARPACTPSMAGGRIVPPKKVRDVSPQYPQALRESGTEGMVRMEGRIGLDGYIGDIRVLGDAQPDLAQAAIAAVREWRYTETLLNCQPTEVMVTVTVNFRHVPPPPAPPPPGGGPY